MTNRLLVSKPMSISKSFTFDSAHYLLNHYGPCQYLHGHTYRMEVIINGYPASEYRQGVTMPGMILDFTYLKQAFNAVCGPWDHALLSPLAADDLDVVWNSTPDHVRRSLGLHEFTRIIPLGVNPTAEFLAQTAVEGIHDWLVGFCPITYHLFSVGVQLWETPTSSAFVSMEFDNGGEFNEESI